MGGSCPEGKRQSTTGPKSWAMVPVVPVGAVLVELAPQLRAEGFTAASVAPDTKTADDPSITNDPSYQTLLKTLGFSPTPIAEISARANLTTAEVSSMLLLLELEGLVEALPGGRYSRLGKKN